MRLRGEPRDRRPLWWCKGPKLAGRNGQNRLSQPLMLAAVRGKASPLRLLVGEAEGSRRLLSFVAYCGLAGLVVTVGAFSCEGKEWKKKGDRIEI